MQPERLKRTKLSIQPSVCSLTNSKISALEWKESTDTSRPKVRVCRVRAAGEEDAEAKTEAGAREAGAEVEPIGGAEVSHDLLPLSMHVLHISRKLPWKRRSQRQLR